VTGNEEEEEECNYRMTTYTREYWKLKGEELDRVCVELAIEEAMEMSQDGTRLSKVLALRHNTGVVPLLL
jgi:hypothetical protein